MQAVQEYFANFDIEKARNNFDAFIQKRTSNPTAEITPDAAVFAQALAIRNNTTTQELKEYVKTMGIVLRLINSNNSRSTQSHIIVRAGPLANFQIIQIVQNVIMRIKQTQTPSTQSTIKSIHSQIITLLQTTTRVVTGNPFRTEDLELDSIFKTKTPQPTTIDKEYDDLIKKITVVPTVLYPVSKEFNIHQLDAYIHQIRAFEHTGEGPVINYSAFIQTAQLLRIWSATFAPNLQRPESIDSSKAKSLPNITGSTPTKPYSFEETHEAIKKAILFISKETGLKNRTRDNMNLGEPKISDSFLETTIQNVTPINLDEPIVRNTDLKKFVNKQIKEEKQKRAREAKGAKEKTEEETKADDILPIRTNTSQNKQTQNELTLEERYKRDRIRWGLPV